MNETQMAGKIIIDIERCKGCTLCVTVCPNNVITISEKSNSKGYFPAVSTGPNCTGCDKHCLCKRTEWFSWRSLEIGVVE